MSPLTDKTLYISNSEVANYNTCERKHFYAHILRLEPFELSMPLALGTAGHEIFEVFYNKLIDGVKYTDAIQFAWNKLDELKLQGLDFKIHQILNDRMMFYFIHFRNMPYDPISSEKTIRVTFGDRPYGFAFRSDLTARILEGKHKDKVGIFDHKFCQNYWTRKKLNMYGQIPRYIWGMQQNGSEVDIGVVAMIRYREFKDPVKADIIKHEIVDPSNEEIDGFVDEFKKSADLVYEQHQKDKKDLFNNARRAINYSCDGCPFVDPCKEGMAGNKKEEIRLLETNYKDSTYGYNN